jgi:two-component sensor histidine kinase
VSEKPGAPEPVVTATVVPVPLSAAERGLRSVDAWTQAPAIARALDAGACTLPLCVVADGVVQWCNAACSALDPGVVATGCSLDAVLTPGLAAELRAGHAVTLRGDGSGPLRLRPLAPAEGSRQLLLVDPVVGGQGSAIAADDIVREMRHRMRNLLSIVVALINDSLGTRPTATGVARLVERLRSLDASGFVDVESDAPPRTRRLLTSVLGRFVALPDRRIRLEGANDALTRRQASLLALIAHELATNCIKYGSLSVRDGRLRIGWSVEADGTLGASWREQGGPPPRVTGRRGYGLGFIERLASGARGRIAFDFTVDGLACALALPPGGTRSARERRS